MRINDLDSQPIHSVPCAVLKRGGGSFRKELPVLRATVAGLPRELAGLLATADLQGHDCQGNGRPRDLSGLVVAREIQHLQRQKQVPPRQALGIVLAGDFFAREKRLGGLGDVTHVWQALRRGRWVAGVLGNHDLLDLPAGDRELRELDGRIVDLDGLRVGGVGGVVGNPAKPNRRPLPEFLYAVEAVVAKRPDLLILHQGPVPACGHSRKGLAELRGLLSRCGRELLVVFGHEPWSEPFEQLTPNVQLLNVHERVVLLGRA